MSRDFFDDFHWHSCIGMDGILEGDRTFRTRLRLSKRLKAEFAMVADADNILIHKATKCLWKMSDDSKYIEPVFDSDVLSDEQLKMMDEG